MLGKDLTSRLLVSEIAKRTGFRKADIRIVLKALESIFYEAIVEKKEVVIGKIGKLYHQVLPPYKGKLQKGMQLREMKGQDIPDIDIPEGRRTAFKIFRTLRKSYKFDDENEWGEDE